MDRLQQILFYKVLGFSLKEIQRLLDHPETGRLQSLENQLNLLKKQQLQREVLIETLEKTIRYTKEGNQMNADDKFKGFRFEDHTAYREEAIEKYGKKVILSAEAKQKGKEAELTDSFNTIFSQFAEDMRAKVPANTPVNIERARQLHQYIRDYAFDCSLEVFGSIGRGYVTDPRFQQNIDQFGEGTAQYVCDAIQAYVNLK